MAIKYCSNCDQTVEAKRVIGVGTFILVLVTGGLWLLIIPFYSKRCPVCRGTNFDSSKVNPDDTILMSQSENGENTSDPVALIEQLKKLKESGAITEEEFISKKTDLLSKI